MCLVLLLLLLFDVIIQWRISVFEHSIVFTSWRQCARPSNTWFLGSHESALNFHSRCMCHSYRLDSSDADIIRTAPRSVLEQGLCICRSSVCPPVCPSMSPAGDIDRLLHGAQQRAMRLANAGSATLSAYVVAEHHRLVIITIVVWCIIFTLIGLPTAVLLSLPDALVVRLEQSVGSDIVSSVSACQGNEFRVK